MLSCVESNIFRYSSPSNIILLLEAYTHPPTVFLALYHLTLAVAAFTYTAFSAATFLSWYGKLSKHMLSWASGGVVEYSHHNKMSYSSKQKHGVTWESPTVSNSLRMISSECNTVEPRIFPVGVVLCNLAVEYNVAAFSELPFAAPWQGRLSRGYE